MPMDMPPPVVEYRIERPAPATGQAAVAAAVARARAASASRAVVMPDLDPSAPAMTDADRAAVAGTSRPGRASLQLPDSYVGQRIKVSMAMARASEASREDAPSPVFMRELRCRMVAVAMDARAGGYVVGGEPAAERARAAMPSEVLKECRAVASAARAREAAAAKEGENCVEPARARPAVRPAMAARMAQAAGRGF